MKKLIIIFAVLLLMGCSAKNDLYSGTYSGTLELTEHVLGAKVAGRVMTLTVKEGDKVNASQVVATMDRYEQAKKDYNRAQELYKTGGADAQSVEYAKLNMEDQEVMVPLDGIVLVKSAEIGETIASGAGVIVIGDPKDQWIKIYLPEAFMGQMHLGQQASIAVDGLGKSYQGHVTFIATEGEFTPRNLQAKEDRMTQVFAIKVSLDHPDEFVHPGVSADVIFKK